MKHKIGAFIVLILAVALFTATLIYLTRDVGISTEPHNDDKTAIAPDDPEPPVDPYAERIETQLTKMSLDDKIAQLLIVQPNSSTLPHPYGGVILMVPNYSTLSGTRQLVQKLQENSALPLIVSTDQEGGIVQRLLEISDKSATNVPNMLRVGNTNDAALAKDVGRVLAEELRVIGVNVDFAPDADVYSNPNNRVIGNRSFSTQPSVVSDMSLAVAHGLSENGVVPTFKHFPGHGDTATDSHVSLPVINKSLEALEATELVPFRAAIKDGAELIMVGHIALPQITGDKTPATLSHKITTELLRETLGFDGLIVTDGLNMGALANNYPEAEIYWRAVEAGADLLLLPSHPELAISSIREHVSEERINESVRRILRFKYRYLEDYQTLDESYFGSAEHAQVIQRIP